MLFFIPNFASNSPVTLISSLIIGKEINFGPMYFNIAPHTSAKTVETVPVANPRLLAIIITKVVSFK